jgi:hypothetical protein
MAKSTLTDVGKLIEAHENAVRNRPGLPLEAVVWLLIYDELPASWGRDLLEKESVFPTPKNECARRAQLRLIDRKREAAEKKVRLPAKGVRGGTAEYKAALEHWKRLNPRPTKKELLGGWVPIPLGSALTNSFSKTFEGKAATSVAPMSRQDQISSSEAGPWNPQVSTEACSGSAHRNSEAGNEPDWQLLALQTAEHAKTPPPMKRTAAPPQFFGPPFPGLNATPEQERDYLNAKESAIREYEEKLLGTGWELDPEWSKQGDPTEHLRPISVRGVSAG